MLLFFPVSSHMIYVLCLFSNSALVSHLWNKTQLWMGIMCDSSTFVRTYNPVSLYTPFICCAKYGNMEGRKHTPLNISEGLQCAPSIVRFRLIEGLMVYSSNHFRIEFQLVWEISNRQIKHKPVTSEASKVKLSWLFSQFCILHFP